jgi:RimJ/RimL family protein N-acetyltransferase
MIDLSTTLAAELTAICEMEQNAETARYILANTLAQHRQNLTLKDTIYLSIREHGKLAGFMVLVLDADGTSVEMRRIVVADKNRGIGQQAMAAMETYCRETLGRQRVWLDVFDYNPRGMHVYRKLGYRLLGEEYIDGQRLLAFEKILG